MKKTIALFAAAGLLMTGCSKADEPTGNTRLLNASNLAALSVVTTPSIPSGTYSITSYGASTGSANNATAINAAITAAGNAGGGTVVVPSGTFISGPIQLKNNVGLQISSGATLKVLAYASYPGAGGTADVVAFIALDGLTNVKISGPGTIDGQGAAWWSAYTTSKAAGAAIARPAIIGVGGGASTLEVNGITILNAPNSHIGIGKNNNSITVTGVTLNSPSNSPNTDGVDVWCTNVNITNCNISCGDDNVAINSNGKYVTVSGCTFGSGHGMSIGSYAANIDHVTVNNCTFNGTDNGIRIKSNRTRSGTVQYLTYSNLTMTNVSTPINVVEYYPDNTIPSSASGDAAQTITTTTPVWKHITFQNITATGASRAGILWAVPEKPMTDLVFDNVKITAATGLTCNYVNGAAFTNGSKITISGGNAFTSTYGSSNITGINLTTGAAQ